MAGEAKFGKTYFGFYCANCKQPMLIAPDPSRGRAKMGGPGTIQTTCAKCGHEGQYPAAEAHSFLVERLH